MKISVLIPAYNCASTIGETIESVLCQTRLPEEILVMDDGSTDNTAAILESYKPRIAVFRQPNGGVGRAFNALCAKARGDLVAFLGSDDIWHPRYLEVQSQLFVDYPSAVAFFTGHVNFFEDETYTWREDPAEALSGVESIPPLEFFKRYNHVTGPFTCFSYCCIPGRVLRELGSEPFKGRAAEDSYCCSLLALLGPVVYAPAPLVAYRVRRKSLSSSHVWTFGEWVHVFELLLDRYRETADRKLLRAFYEAFASKRRAYAKLLMGAGRPVEARIQAKSSIRTCATASSIAKSLGLLMLTYMPSYLQPAWPVSYREQVGSQ